MTTTLTALMGIPGCGKSTYIRDHFLIGDEDYDAVVVCPDEIRARPEFGGDVNSQTNNGAVFAQAHREALEALRDGKDVIWDATNVTDRARADILRTAEVTKATAALVVLDVPLPLAKERNAGRERVVPEHVLDRMSIQFVESLSRLMFERWNHIEYIRVDDGR